MSLTSRITDLAVVMRDKINSMTPRLLPTGGTTGQVLAKNTGSAYDTKWVDGAVPLYTWIAYSSAADGSADFSLIASSGTKYLGIAANKTTPTPSTNAAAYSWVALGAAAAPAASFTGQPTVSPLNGQPNQTYTATPGVVANGSITSRAWLLNGTSISITLTATPSATGTLTYQEFSGTVASNLITTTVAAPVVSFAQQPTVSPASGSAGQTYTATPGAVNNGSVTSREWRQGGQVVSTSLTYSSAAAGSGTYQEFSGSVASDLIAFTVAAAASTPWILANGTWDDNAPWNDTQVWKDAA